jgi:hypothetical protein
MAAHLESPDQNADLNDRFYTLVGQIVVSFNSLEAILRECVAAHVAAQNFALAVVVLSRASFSELVEMFNVAASYSAQALPDRDAFVRKVADITKDLKNVNDSRNRIVHSQFHEELWIRAGIDQELYPETVLFRTKIRRNLEHVLEPSRASEKIASLEELESVLQQIMSAYRDLGSMWKSLVWRPLWAEADTE